MAKIFPLKQSNDGEILTLWCFKELNSGPGEDPEGWRSRKVVFWANRCSGEAAGEASAGSCGCPQWPLW